MTEPKNTEGFRISLPDGWKNETIYTYKGPDDSGVQHNLIIQVDPEPETRDLLLYAKQRLQALRDSLQGFELLAEKEKKLKSGIPAYEVVFKWIPSGDKIIFQKQDYLISGEKAYNFTASFSKQSLKTIGVDVDNIIDTFNPN
jgi:hypothetical protein